ncbi:MAG: thiamine pyrophosphate-dependent enzyme [Archaeoglobaceae archaeon]
MARYRCTVCNYIYDEEKEGTRFDDLPDTWTCPVCGAPKSAFVPLGLSTGEAETSVADKMVEQLEAFGVKYIYGIPGDSNLPLIEAIRKSNIKFVLTRHEETAAFMADAHGKMTDEVGVCISIAGPGSTNLVTGLMDAVNDRSSVLALVGQIPELYLGSEGLQEIDQIELFSSFAAYAETVARPNQALRVTMMAIKYAYRDPGASVLSCPTDVLSEGLSDKINQPDRRLFRARVGGNEQDIKKAVELINESERPAILAGWGARHSGDLLNHLASKLKAPIATTSRAKGVVHETHQFSVGVLGTIGTPHAARAIKGCDLLIIVGSIFRQANLVPPDIKIVQIDVDPSRVGKTFNVDAGIVGDSRSVLEDMLPQLNEKQGEEGYLSHIFTIKKEFLKEIEEDSQNLSKPIYPGYVIQAIKRHVDSNAIICVDVGDHTYWFYRKFICEGQRTFLSANIASMGFGFPASLSAKLDYPDKQVVCVTGDGGFGMLMADFTTAVRENLPVKVVLFNDGKLKNIKKEQLAESYPAFGIEFPNPDFAQYAVSCGGEGYRVSEPQDLNDVLEKAFKSDKASLIEVMVDPEAVIPGVFKVE